jgi:hypothetical protein
MVKFLEIDLLDTNFVQTNNAAANLFFHTRLPLSTSPLASQAAFLLRNAKSKTAFFT